MGLEILACALMAAFFLGGIVAPISIWISVVVLQRRRLVEGLRSSGLRGIEDAGDEDAEAPVRLLLHANARRLVAAALTRGGRDVWQVRVPVDQAPSLAFALEREEVARRLPELRHLPAVEPLLGLPWGFHLSTTDRELLARDLAARLPAATSRLLSGGLTLVQCAFTGEEIVIEVQREALTASGLLRALRRSWEFAEGIGAVRGPLRFTDEGRSHQLVLASRSGAPVALPG